MPEDMVPLQKPSDNPTCHVTVLTSNQAGRCRWSSSERYPCAMPNLTWSGRSANWAQGRDGGKACQGVPGVLMEGVLLSSELCRMPFALASRVSQVLCPATFLKVNGSAGAHHGAHPRCAIWWMASKVHSRRALLPIWQNLRTHLDLHLSKLSAPGRLDKVDSKLNKQGDCVEEATLAV